MLELTSASPVAKAVADQVRMMESGRSTRLDDMVSPSSTIRPEFVKELQRYVDRGEIVMVELGVYTKPPVR